MKPFWLVLVSLTVLTLTAVRLAEQDGHLYLERRYPERALTPEEVWVKPKGYLNNGQLRLTQIAQLKQPADILIFGNSRIQSLSGQAFNKKWQTINLSVGGASLEDVVIIWQAYRERYPAPKYVIALIDPDVLYKELQYSYKGSRSTPADLHRKGNLFTLASLYHLKGLFSWDGLRVALGTLNSVRNPDQQHATIMLRNQLPPTWTAYTSDGSVIEPATTHSVKEVTMGILNEFYKTWDPIPFNRPDPTGTRPTLLKNWALDVKKSGGHLYLLVPPYHPAAYRIMRSRFPKKLNDFSDIVQKAAVQSGVTFCDTMDASQLGCSPAEFRDNIHVAPACMQRALEACFKKESSSLF